MNEHEQVTAMLGAKNAAPLELDPARTALIIVDMQRYFTQPSFPFTNLFERLSPGVCAGYLRRVQEKVIPSIRRLLDHFRNNGSLVVYTAVGTETTDGSDLACWARALDETALNVLGTRVHPPVGDPSWQIDAALEPRAGEIIVNKLSAGTFATTDLEERLRSRGIDRVVITGVVTDVCVSTTAREAADRNFKVVVVSDACTTFSEALHQANLQTLHVFGWVRGTEEVIQLCEGSERKLGTYPNFPREIFS
jgi:nicotinamidase-related amidase